MECYNCGAKLGKGDICQNCGANVKIYKKIIMASNAYYNDALEKAAVRDLSGAIESLRTSLRFYKMNIDARNLLGLVYFETGEVVEALTEWVISKNYQPRDNAASRYLNEIQNNPSRLDTINQTIKKYNQALLYCRQDSPGSGDHPAQESAVLKSEAGKRSSAARAPLHSGEEVRPCQEVASECGKN